MTDESNVLLPKLGESIHSAKIVQWLKKEGDPVRRDEPLVEVSTDKVASEIPAPLAGIMGPILKKEGEECFVGELLCTIRGIGSTAPKKERGFLSPAVLRLLEEKGLSSDAVEHLQGTGEGGRITRKDIEELARGTPCKKERTPLSFVRQAIAENMERAHREVPMAHLITKVDVTNLLAKIAKEKAFFQEKWQEKLTITAYIAHAYIEALKTHPLLRARYSKEGLIHSEEIGLGIAVQSKEELFVPVLKQCKNLTVEACALEIAKLSRKTAEGLLSSSDMEGGVATLTNFGMSGIEIGLPILRYPETSILAVGAIEKRVEVLEGDSYGVRSIMYITLGFDHRVLDGMLAASFLKTIKERLSAE
jgi:2-oxoglutarate dehydrogenase E2 component (dihydrolipoamide succinyltransferase)